MAEQSTDFFLHHTMDLHVAVLATYRSAVRFEAVLDDRINCLGKTIKHSRTFLNRFV